MSSQLLRRMQISFFCGAWMWIAVAQVRSDQGSGPTGSTRAEDSSPVEHIVIDENIWLRFSDDPPHHMGRARNHFLKHEMQAASHELHKVGGYLHAAASHADEDLKQALIDSAEEIDELAIGVKAGTVHSVEELEKSFSRAQHALAMHHYRLAQRAAARSEAVLSGRYLKTAIENGEQAAYWAGHKLEAGTVKVFGGARDLAGRMIEVPGFLLQESSHGLNSVGEELQHFGKWIELPPRDQKPKASTKK